MRGVAKSLYKHYGEEIKLIGFLEGYHGLMYEKYRELEPLDFSGILTEGGTILGTSRQPFRLMTKPDENGMNKVKLMKKTYAKLKIDCLVILGGNGTHKTSNLLWQEGLNVIGLPKTIDKDLWGTDMTFGFQSAVELATNAIDCIHTTAFSHRRIFIVEVMGHKVGWLTLHAGIAGGADIILIPEIPYDMNKIIKVIEQRKEEGKRFSILAVAEGVISKDDSELPKKALKAKFLNNPYPSISYKIGAELEERIGVDTEIRITVPGHTIRGGSPCAFDRVIASRLGAAAAKLAIDENYGNMVAFQNDEIIPVPLSEVAGKLKSVDPKSSIVRETRSLGISFGD
jgi:6-phosphofructokinase 1